MMGDMPSIQPTGSVADSDASVHSRYLNKLQELFPSHLLSGVKEEMPIRLETHPMIVKVSHCTKILLVPASMTIH